MSFLRKNKIVYFHYDVGSGVEFAGHQFQKWICQKGKKADIIRLQDMATTQFERLLSAEPDIIILNELYKSSVESTYYYKRFKPKTKVIIICHVWKDLVFENNDIDYGTKLRKLLDISDYIYCINYKPSNIKLLSDSWQKKFFNFGYPVDHNEYKPMKKWEDRESFGYFGNILPHKISHKFIKEYDGPIIDFYGREFTERYPQYREYYKDFFNNKSFVYKGLQDQVSMPAIMNDYKYFVIPHVGYEPFNVALLQALKCGCIPLISSNSEWPEWADGLYFGCNTERDLINNIKKINADKPDFSSISAHLVREAGIKFNYNEMKDVFQELL